MESDHDELFFTDYVTLLLSLILLKRSWTKKITIGNKNLDVRKQKLGFFDIMMDRR